MTERRMNPALRAKRIKAGGASVLIAPVVVWALQEYAGLENMPDNVAMSIGALLGAFMSWIALCFDDLRAMVLAYYHNKMQADRRDTD